MSKIEIYSSLSAEDAIDVEGKNISHPRLREMHLKMVPLLSLLAVRHVSYENPESDKLVLRQGQIVVHRDLREKFLALFAGWLYLQYPIEHAIPISQSPDSQDGYSMARNRTLVYRPDVIGDAADPTAPASEHYRAHAVDVSPFHNPIVNPDHTVEPPEAVGHLPRLGMVLLRRPDVVEYARSVGFEWGNDWPDPRFGEGFYGITASGQSRHILRDSHHFELVPSLAAQLEMPGDI
jgi:hypothetical protein